MTITLSDCKKAIAKTAGIYLASERLDKINKCLDGYGIECIRSAKHYNHYYGDICAEYINMGDTYCPTVIYDTIKAKFCAMSWGDFVEKYQTKYQII